VSVAKIVIEINSGKDKDLISKDTFIEAGKILENKIMN
jgi:hypothetical protein